MKMKQFAKNTLIIASGVAFLIFFNKFATEGKIASSMKNCSVTANAHDTTYFKQKLAKLDSLYARFEKQVVEIRRILKIGIGSDTSDITKLTVERFESRVKIKIEKFAEMNNEIWKTHRSLYAELEKFKEEFGPVATEAIIQNSSGSTYYSISRDFNVLVMKMDLARLTHQETGSVIVYMLGQIDLETMKKELNEYGREKDSIKSAPVMIIDSKMIINFK